MANKNGLTYYKLESDYSGDITKFCGLTGAEVDSNFFYLRGMDIKSVIWDSQCQKLFFRRVNGDEFAIDIDSSEHVAHQVESIIAKLFDDFSKSLKFTVYHDTTLSGDGNISNILGVSKTILSGYHTPAKKMLNAVSGETLPIVAEKGEVYLTYENISPNGLLYNWEGVKVIEEKLKSAKSNWRIPTLNDWSYMLNAIEDDKHRNHVSKLSNVDLGEKAGIYLKSKNGSWEISEDAGVTISGSCECNDDCKGILPIHYDNEGKPCFGTNLKDLPKNGCGCCDYPKIKTIDSYSFNAEPCGYVDRKGHSHDYGESAVFWTNNICETITDIWSKSIDWDKNTVHQQAENKDNFYSLRLVKDLDSTFTELEEIDGVLYHCVAMPYIDENGFKKHAVWTVENYTDSTLLNGNKCHPKAQAYYVRDQHGCVSKPYGRIMINTWNTNFWERRELAENEVIVLEVGPDGSKDEEWVNIHGMLQKRSDIYTAIITNNIMTPINARFDDDEEWLSRLDRDLKNEILRREVEDEKLQAQINELSSALTQEILTREAEDEILQEEIDEINSALTQEIEERIEGDKILDEYIDTVYSALTQEIDDRIEADEHLQEEIDILSSALTQEIEDREAADEELWSGLTQERQEREDYDNQLSSALTQETEEREVADDELWSGLTQERQEREEDVRMLLSGLTQERYERKDADEKLSSAITKEMQTRYDNDIKQTDYTFYLNDKDSKTSSYLETNDGTKIMIKFDSDYGTFEDKCGVGDGK